MRVPIASTLDVEAVSCPLVDPSTAVGLGREEHAGAGDDGRVLLGVAADGNLVDLDDSWPLLVDALAGEGVDSRVAVWDDPAIDWASYDLVTVMYAWGYVTRRGAFLDWAEAAAAVTKVVNEPAICVRTATRPTCRTSPTLASPWYRQRGFRLAGPGNHRRADYVIKPTVASGGLDAARYRSTPRYVADAHVRRLHDAGQTAMIQPYQISVDSAGETALVFLGGLFSHAVTKGRLLDADAGETERLWEREVITPGVPTAAQRQAADAVMASVTARCGPTVYARVDLVDDAEGRPMLLEAELVEPSLFLATAAGSPQRFAAVLANRMGSCM